MALRTDITGSTAAAGLHALLHNQADAEINTLDGEVATLISQVTGLLSGGSGSTYGVYDVTSSTYHADNTGATDVTAAVRSAYADLVAAGGGELRFPRGVYKCDNVAFSAALALSRDNAKTRGRTRITIAPGARIVLSANTPRFIDFAKVADYDWFGNLTIGGGGVIDANNVGGRHHVLIGTLAANAFQTRVQFGSIAVENIRLINVATDQSGTNQRWGIGLVPAYTPGDTPVTMTDFSFVGYRCEGGNAGIELSGLSTTGSASDPTLNAIPVTFDRIYYRDCFWNTGVVPTGTVGATGFHLGGHALVGSALFVSCEAYGSYDDNFEINNARLVVLKRCRGKDAWLNTVMVTNFRAPADPHQNTVIFEDCEFEIGTVTNATANTFGMQNNTSTPVSNGVVVIRDCRSVDTRTGAIAWDGWGSHIELAGGTLQRGLIIRNLEVVSSGWVWNGGDMNYRPIHLNPTGPGIIDIEGLSLYCHGTQSLSATGNVFTQLINVSPAAGAGTDWVKVKMRNVSIDYGVVNQVNFTTQLLYLGLQASKFDFELDGLTVLAAAIGAADQAIHVASTATLTIPLELRMRNLNFAGMTTGIEISIDATNAPKVRTENVIWRSLARLDSSTSGLPATTVAYQNLTGHAELITIGGGTVTQIALTPRGGTLRNTGCTQGAFVLEPGDSITPTYSSAPTWTRIPLGGV